MTAIESVTVASASLVSSQAVVDAGLDLADQVLADDHRGEADDDPEDADADHRMRRWSSWHPLHGPSPLMIELAGSGAQTTARRRRVPSERQDEHDQPVGRESGDRARDRTGAPQHHVAQQLHPVA